MAKRKYHVIPHPKDGWGIYLDKSDKSIKNFTTKDEALKEARTLAKNNDGELVIHGMDGKVLQSSGSPKDDKKEVKKDAKNKKKK